MHDARSAFLAVARQTAALLRGDVLASRWDDDSALADLRVGALAAHTGRAVLVTRDYLLAPPPPKGAELLDPAAYYLAALGDAPPDDPLHVGVRARAAEGAAAGPEALAAAVDRAVHEVGPLLDEVSQDRTVAAFDGLAMLVDDYLDTRLVELVVHLDDLGASLDTPDLVVDEVAGARAVGVLAEIARRRHSTGAVVRLLARRERAATGIHAL